MGIRAILIRHRAVFALVAAFAIAARALIPVGWMPSAAPGQLISICSGSGATTAWIDADGKIHKSQPKSEKGHADAPCAFAGLASGADAPPAQIVLSFAPAPSQTPFIGVDKPAPGRGLAAPPPFQTGPPTLS